MSNGLPVTLDCIIFGLQRFGGISNYWAKLVNHAGADSELAPSLVVPKSSTYRDLGPDWTQRMQVLREAHDPRVTRYLRSKVASSDSVFHTSYYRLPQRRCAKYVVSAYDFTYERYRQGLARVVHSTQKFASLRRADAVLCISNVTRLDILEHCRDVDPAKLHVVHLGVDRAMFYEEIPAVRSIPEHTVLFVGQRGGYKRFDLAVDAVRQSPRLTLGIAGPPLTDDERAGLDAALGSRWHACGAVSPAELRRLYSSAFAFIFPSDYEGFGLPVLEAMACACPVVAAERSSLPEVGGAAALYAGEQTGASYASALHALDSNAMRGEAVRAGLERVEEFPWARTMQHTVALYQQ